MGSGKFLYDGASNSSVAKARFIDCKLNAAVGKTTVPHSSGANEVDFVRSGAAGVNYTVYSHRVTGLLTEETTIVRTGGAEA